jgi:hypothetical protein
MRDEKTGSFSGWSKTSSLSSCMIQMKTRQQSKTFPLRDYCKWLLTAYFWIIIQLKSRECIVSFLLASLLSKDPKRAAYTLRTRKHTFLWITVVVQLCSTLCNCIVFRNVLQAGCFSWWLGIAKKKQISNQEDSCMNWILTETACCSLVDSIRTYCLLLVLSSWEIVWSLWSSVTFPELLEKNNEKKIQRNPWNRKEFKRKSNHEKTKKKEWEINSLSMTLFVCRERKTECYFTLKLSSHLHWSQIFGWISDKKRI